MGDGITTAEKIQAMMALGSTKAEAIAELADMGEISMATADRLLAKG